MKKWLLVLLVFSCLVFLNSCFFNERIEMVKVDDAVYENVYLYSFKDAELEGTNVSHLFEDFSPTSCGYVYSNKELSAGDKIKVWEYQLDRNKDNIYSFNDFGTDAIVDELIESYYIKVKESKDTYIITYYEFGGFNSTASNKQDLCEIEMNKIEVVKERATIKYKTK